MKIFYLDNFRGFQHTTIPIVDVNFCVGENSTGKTSFLSLINLLSSQRFWFEQTIELGESAFGHFDDIVSINSKDQSYFRIGYAESVPADINDSNGETEETAVGYLFTYIKTEGMPRLHKCTRNYGRDVVTITFTKKSTRYKITKLNSTPCISDFRKQMFSDWSVTHNQKVTSGYKVITDELVIADSMPILYALSYIYEMELQPNRKKGMRHYFGIPGPSFGGSVTWIAPIRTKPRRTYDEVRSEYSPEGEHTPYVMKKILDSGSKAKRFQVFMERFGKESGLFKEVNVHRFGTSVTSPFELEVVLEAKPLNISSVGYGVSQGLPVVVELFVQERGTWFAIQQPEVHLHPRAQAAIGELIYELATTENKKFIVETHSDFTIDRYRVRVREGNGEHQSQILFFRRKNGINIVHPIQITNSGDLEDNLPKIYRKFFLKEGLRVIGV